MGDARFRDTFQAKIAALKSAPEFSDCVQYEALKDLIELSACPPGDHPRAAQAPPRLPMMRRSISKGSSAESPSGARGASSVADWQAAVEAKLLAEAGRVHENIRLVEDRLLDSNNFIGALNDKACDGTAFTSGDMQQLLSVQKERDKLAMELDEYKSLNLRALMKLLKLYHDNGGTDVYKLLLPRVLREVSLQPPSPQKGSCGWAHNLDAFFDNAIQDLGDEERDCFLESRAIIKHQCSEVLGGLYSLEPLESGATEEFARTPSVCRRMALPVVKVVLSEYGLTQLSRDVMAAAVISVAGIPKAMSYAALADLPVTAGIATLYLPALVYALLGSSRQVAISPQSVTCLLLGQMVAETVQGTEYEGDAMQQLGLAMTLTFHTGLVITIFGALNLSFLLNFISKSVLSGFISASAIIAAVSTVKNLLGLHVKKSPILYVLVQRIVADLGHVHWPTALISIAGISIMVVMPRVQKRAAKRLKGAEHPLARGLYFVMKVPAVLYFMVMGMLLGSFLCNFEPFTEWQVDHLVAGRGATAPSLYFQHVNDRFSCSHHSSRVTALYEPTSSGDGLEVGTMNASAPVQFAASDVLPPEETGSLALPVLSTFVCAVVHIPFLRDSQQINLVLDAPTVAAIFAGEVRQWSDPRIKLANPNLPWESLGQNASISVVGRAGRSGTTAAFVAGLLGCRGCNASRWPPGLVVDWGAPRLREANGNAGVVEAVAATPWSIGYATYGAVEAAGDPNARCLAWKVDREKVITPALAWRYPDKFPWPVPLTSYVLIPGLNESSCRARSWLQRYLEDLYSFGAIAQKLQYQLLPRPAELETLACAGDDARRLGAAGGGGGGGGDPEEFTCALPAPTCSEIQVVGHIDTSLPRLTIPHTDVHLEWSTRLRFALMLAAVALLEHVANVKLYADREGYSVSMSTDLIAVGLANMAGALFGSFVVAGGFSRSALNEKAASQISLLLSALISFVVVFAISSLLSMLPDAVLNIILFCAVVPLVDVKTATSLAHLGRYGFADLLALAVAFFATCFLGVVQGMLLAIMVSLVEFVWKSLFPQISELFRTPGSLHYVPEQAEEPFRDSVLAFKLPRLSDKSGGGAAAAVKRKTVRVFRFEAPLWFANAANLSDLLLPALKGVALQGIILDMSTVPWMDNTAANILKQILAAADERQVLVVFASVNQDVRYFLVQVCHVQPRQLLKSLYAAEMAVRAGLPAASPDSTPSSRGAGGGWGSKPCKQARVARLGGGSGGGVFRGEATPTEVVRIDGGSFCGDTIPADFGMR